MCACARGSVRPSCGACARAADGQLTARSTRRVGRRYEPLFDTLRTKQQLGYTVGCSSRATHGQLGFVIRIVSATHSAAQCEGAAARFLRGFADDLLGTMRADTCARRTAPRPRTARSPKIWRQPSAAPASQRGPAPRSHACPPDWRVRSGAALVGACAARSYAKHVDSAVANKLQEDHSATDEVRGRGGERARLRSRAAPPHPPGACVRARAGGHAGVALPRRGRESPVHV